LNVTLPQVVNVREDLKYKISQIPACIYTDEKDRETRALAGVSNSAKVQITRTELTINEARTLYAWLGEILGERVTLQFYASEPPKIKKGAKDPRRKVIVGSGVQP
jgi:hypothetical protein